MMLRLVTATSSTVTPRIAVRSTIIASATRHTVSASSFAFAASSSAASSTFFSSSSSRTFSTNAIAPISSPSSALTVGMVDSLQTHAERYPTGMSPTQAVIEALRAGPMTRKQLFYAINRNPPAPLPPVKRSTERAPGFNKEAPKLTVMQQIALKKAEEENAPHQYPTGYLRNPTHLTVIMQKLVKSGRVKTVSHDRIIGRMTEKEKAAIDDLTQNHPYGSNLAKAMRDSAPSKLQLAKLTTPTAGITTSWYYVLKEWSAPHLTPKYTAARELYLAKAERRLERKRQAIVAAEMEGKPLLFGRPIQPTRKVLMRQHKAKRLEDHKAKFAEVTEKYREKVLEQPEESVDEFVKNLQETEGADISHQRIVGAIRERSMRTRYAVDGTVEDYIFKLRTECPRMNEAAIKEACSKRASIIRRLERRQKKQEQPEQQAQ